jgi:hypothetical protein
MISDFAFGGVSFEFAPRQAEVDFLKGLNPSPSSPEQPI